MWFMRVLSVNFINNTCFFSAFPHKYAFKYAFILAIDRETSHKKLANALSKFFNNVDAYDG